MSGMTAVKGSLTSTAASLSSFSNIALAAMSGAVVGVMAFQKALEFADEGAQIAQTRDAFNGLATSLGEGPGLLQELQAATRGTVTELDLMRSTSTLLAGTSGELGQALAENAPQLAAIAQAAHDLNPTMGTTAEMYDRLSRGIKKAEPELLDEVGILMNLTQVYKAYADSIGVPVTALDKQQKAQAMLNEVLKQGNTLLEQAAGVNTSTSTSIDRMQASMENAGNAMKELMVPGIANVFDGFTALATGTGTVNAALAAHAKEVYNTASSYEAYETELRRAAQAAGYVVDGAGALRNAWGKVIQTNYMLEESQYSLNKSISATLDAHMQLSSTLPEATEAVYDQEAAMTAYGERLTGLAGYYAELEAAEQNRIMTAGLMAGIQGTLGDATTNYSMTLAQLTEQETAITDALVDAQSAAMHRPARR